MISSRAVLICVFHTRRFNTHCHNQPRKSHPFLLWGNTSWAPYCRRWETIGFHVGCRFNQQHRSPTRRRMTSRTGTESDCAGHWWHWLFWERQTVRVVQCHKKPLAKFRFHRFQQVRLSKCHWLGTLQVLSSGSCVFFSMAIAIWSASAIVSTRVFAVHGLSKSARYSRGR